MIQTAKETPEESNFRDAATFLSTSMLSQFVPSKNADINS